MNEMFAAIRKHWRPVVLLSILGVAVLAYLYTTGAWGGQDETWERIQREGLVPIGMDASYPPFNLVDASGAFIGYDVDLADTISRDLGVRPEFSDISFDGLYDALLSGKIDMIVSALPHDRLLTRDVAYSYSYFNAGQVILTSSSEDSVRSREDLAFKVVAVELGSAAHQEGRLIQGEDELEFELQPHRTPEDVVAAILEDSADAALFDGISARQLISQGTPLAIVDGPVSDEPYVIAVRPDSSVLLQRVNEALVRLREEGYMDELAERWF